MKKMNIRFVLRKARTNAKGLCPICLRLTSAGQKTSDINTGLFVKPDLWSAKTQKVKGNSRDAENTNRMLRGMYYQLDSIYQNYLTMDTELTPSELLSFYQGGDRIAEVGQRYLELLQRKGRASGTIKRYRRSFDLLVEFVSNAPIRTITRKQTHEFWPWLYGTKKFKQNYCNKVLQACKGMLDHAVRIGHLEKNPFAHIRLEWDGEMDVTCLSKQELQKLQSLKWSSRLQCVVDAFLVMCYSGMHIGDYLAFETEHITTIRFENEEGQRIEQEIIRYKRGKTGVVAIAPLHPVVVRVIEKYGSVEDLPRISTQKMNDYLKLVAERIGTSKNLTNKIARKTFTDICINEYGMSLEAVAGSLGHTSTRQVKHYGTIREARILNEWNKGQIRID